MPLYRSFFYALGRPMFGCLCLTGCSEGGLEPAQWANLPTLVAQSELVRGRTPATPRNRFSKHLAGQTSEERGSSIPLALPTQRLPRREIGLKDRRNKDRAMAKSASDGSARVIFVNARTNGNWNHKADLVVLVTRPGKRPQHASVAALRPRSARPCRRKLSGGLGRVRSRLMSLPIPNHRYLDNRQLVSLLGCAVGSALVPDGRSTAGATGGTALVSNQHSSFGQHNAIWYGDY